MSATSTSGGYHFRCPTGGEHISRLVETRRGKKTFLPSKNFLLMRYNITHSVGVYCLLFYAFITILNNYLTQIPYT
jgi:hypothetical protein